MSPSVWWDNKLLVRDVKSLKTKPALRIWLDIGTGEGDRAVAGVKELRDALTAKGWVLNSELAYLEAKGAQHDDQAWGARAGVMLKHLFPRQSSRSDSR